jgi:hypothetical protein
MDGHVALCTRGKVLSDKKLKAEGKTAKAADEFQAAVSGIEYTVRADNQPASVGESPWKWS